ncbi:Hsp20/alpha crystallin family protein [Streptomyces sp. ISL-96]|uniref:Hsp20/alpha crystallin family protein n=1 Tax=Streptomyces sp. ISL-96 TaxID=2819191 RepID=UPI001BE61AC5|nr:Hsp20/alpha crystallin family protein [Streptomyces sp. ISL-96]MBT2489670.1 Hsp20/alpha crystallin family protein [Streptomyces sp. ISL-96]
MADAGELSEEQRGKVLSRRTGKFLYRTSLPGGADSENIDADLTDGILTVRIPKAAEGKAPQDRDRRSPPGQRRQGIAGHPLVRGPGDRFLSQSVSGSST